MRVSIVAIIIVAPDVAEAPVGLEADLQEPVERCGENLGAPEFAREDNDGHRLDSELAAVDPLTVDGGDGEDGLFDGVDLRLLDVPLPDGVGIELLAQKLQLDDRMAPMIAIETLGS